MSLTFTVAELPERPAPPPPGSPEDWGVAVADLTPNLARRLGLPSERRGVVITAVAPGTPAAEANIEPGDIIREVDRHEVHSVRDYRATVAKSGPQLLLLVQRGDVSSFVALRRE